MNNLPVIDLVFLIFIGLMVIHGFTRGFIAEFFSWAALILSIWAAVLLYSPGAEFIRSKGMHSVRYVPEILAFIGVFLISMLALKMLEQVLRDIVMGAKLGGLNKFFGLIFGLIEGLTFTTLILFILSIQPVFDASKLTADSNFARILHPIMRIPFDRGRDILNTAILLLPGVPASVL